MNAEQARCDVCGEPATSLCVDLIEVDNYRTMCVEYKPIQPVKAGCNAHPVESEVIGREVVL